MTSRDDPISVLTHAGATPWFDAADTWPIGLLDEVLWCAEVLQDSQYPCWEWVSNWGIVAFGLS